MTCRCAKPLNKASELIEIDGTGLNSIELEIEIEIEIEIEVELDRT